MERRELGRSGVSVTRIVLGCGNFGGVGSSPAFFGQGIAHDEAFRIMDAGWELGIRTFDTADAYGGGRSESWIGEWLADEGLGGARRDRHRDEDVQPDGGGRRPRARSRADRRQLESSLRRLGVERVDLYLAHAFDPDMPHEETLSAFDALVRAGKVGAVGASNFSAEQLAEAVEISELEGLVRYEWVQNSFSLLERGDAETVFPVCHEHGLGYEAFGPLAGGWLAGRYRRGEAYPDGSRMTQRPDGYRNYESDAVFDALEALDERRARARRLDGGPRARLAPRRPRGDRSRRRADEGGAARAGARGACARARLRRARPSARLVRVIVLSEHEVRELLDMESCIEAMEEVLASLARGELYNPLRSVARPEGADTLLGLMPGLPRGLDARVRAQGDRDRADEPRAAASTRTWAASSSTTARRASSSRS